ncbi:MAG: DUF3726 domain-containing protein [Rhodobacter sp.]|nr:DUF3726 domain-containing protein [Rhodobacter sp.]
MSYSLGEIEALCRKAAVGAGLGWGLADDAATAVRWLESYGLPGAITLAAHLDADDMAAGPEIAGAVWSGGTAMLCPIRAGAAFCDHAYLLATTPEIRLQRLRYPLLFLPFAHHAARLNGASLRIHSDQGQALVCENGPRVDADLARATTANVICTVCTDSISPVARSGRADPPRGIYDRLGALAQRTYAPATEVSRIGGAGAGLTDND